VQQRLGGVIHTTEIRCLHVYDVSGACGDEQFDVLQRAAPLIDHDLDAAAARCWARNSRPAQSSLPASHGRVIRSGT
jgi:hypothetical protein